MKILFAILFTAVVSFTVHAETSDHALEKNPSLGKTPAAINSRVLSKPVSDEALEKNPAAGLKPGNLEPEVLQKRRGLVNQMLGIYLGADDSKTSFEAADAIEKVSAKILEAAQKWGKAPKNEALAKKHYKQTMAELLVLNGKFCGGSVGKGDAVPNKENPKDKTAALKGLFE